MDVASFRLLWFLCCLLVIPIPQASGQDGVPYNCDNNIGNYTANSTYHKNLNTVLSTLTSNTEINYGFYNLTYGQNTDKVYATGMCRGDVKPDECRSCLNDSRVLTQVCPNQKGAIRWHDKCILRYSNSSFFGIKETLPMIQIFILQNATNADQFNQALDHLLRSLSSTAASGDSRRKYAANSSATVLQNIYGLVQCTPDLSHQDCSDCLEATISTLPICCNGKIGAKIITPSCNIRYDLYPFYSSSNAPEPVLVPETRYSYTDSRNSEDPRYLSHNCSNSENFTANSAFQSNLKNVLSYLSGNATSGQKFWKAGVSDTVYGLFMCRGDLPTRLCGQCVKNATQRISSECGSSEEAIIWYSHCFLRYSDRYFFSRRETSPIYKDLNITNASNPNQEQNFFADTSSILARVANETGDSMEKYVVEASKLNYNQTLYTLAQCTRDLSSDDCSGCLIHVIVSTIQWPNLGSAGGRVLYPSCNMRFELFPFYRDGPDGHEDQPPPLGTTEGKKSWSRSPTILLIVLPVVVVSVMLFSVCCFLLRRKARKSNKTILRENFGHESATLEPLQFHLAIIEAATNNFSYQNKIGKGGFGEVYEAILPDGRHVAVKRLSRNSKQGAVEFKNEILLIAKLQHRNLVTFIGFCLEEQEMILVYEYVPNKSLDYFLFVIDCKTCFTYSKSFVDTQQQRLLSWFERYSIIGGIARGVLYLHEYSRLKVIHRDLKPSNILLDENMNPKISDFGIARIIEIDQNEENTNKIVGTYGYMSPEYAMLGQFSEKSDVFSFGVIVLEMITGKKNASSSASRVADGLLSYVWRQWSVQTPLSILDPYISENYSQIEVIKCIQIGLLCVQENPDARPTMATVVSYLSNHSIELPSPSEPAFFLHSRMGPGEVAHESSSSQYDVNNSRPFSINEMSISKFLPR